MDIMGLLFVGLFFGCLWKSFKVHDDYCAEIIAELDEELEELDGH